MLRDNHEAFAPEFSKILHQLGVEDEGMSRGFQLLKFERLEPDVFVWMLRGRGNYIATIADDSSSAPSLDWLADWSNGLKPEDFELLVPDDDGREKYVGLEDGYDFVQVYVLPQDYDH